MNTASIILLYSFSCSTVLLYGLGLEKANQDSRSPRLLLSRLPLLALELCIAVPVSKSIIDFALVPGGFPSLSPLATMFVSALTVLALSAFLPGTANAETGERIFFFGTAYLAIAEGITFTGSLAIAAASLLSYVLVSFLLIAIRDRFSVSRISDDWKGLPIILVSLGLLFIVINAADAAWWLQGGYR